MVIRVIGFTAKDTRKLASIGSILVILNLMDIKGFIVLLERIEKRIV
jgi:hypothetical protein